MSDKNMHIEPPPSESGDQPLYRVIYAIDVNASDEQHAAQTAWQLMRARDAFDPILTVLNAEGKQTQLDLSDILEFNKITVGFISQKFRRQEDGRFICVNQMFVAGDDVQYENVKGEPIEDPGHEYQPFEMTLVRTRLIIDHINEVLSSLDVGGEQSRQFASEIEILGKLLKNLGSEPQD